MLFICILYLQLDIGLGGICAIEPLHTGHGDDVSAVVGMTSNCIVEGSFDSSFHPVVQVFTNSFSTLDIFSFFGLPLLVEGNRGQALGRKGVGGLC